MSTNDTFLAIFLANKTSPRMTAWNSLSEEARRAKMQEGIAAWVGPALLESDCLISGLSQNIRLRSDQVGAL